MRSRTRSEEKRSRRSDYDYDFSLPAFISGSRQYFLERGRNMAALEQVLDGLSVRVDQFTCVFC